METLKENLSLLFFLFEETETKKGQKKKKKAQGHTVTKQDKPWAAKSQNLYSLSPPSCLSHILIYNKEFS